MSDLSESDLSVAIYIPLKRIFVHKPPKFIGETRTKVTQGMGDAEGLKLLVKALAFLDIFARLRVFALVRPLKS